MASEPVRSSSVQAAPKDYSIPQAQQIRLLSVTASFTDNGAAGDWLPAVVILDNNGNALCRAVDQGVKVTAGSDAEVSWFPGVKHAAAAAASTSAVFARAIRDALGGLGDPTQQVNAGATTNASFPHTFTTDNAVIDWTTAINQNDTAELNRVGTYLVWANAHWDSTSLSLTSTIMDPSASGFPHSNTQPTGNPAFGDSVGSATSEDYNTLHVAAPTASIHIAHGNATGVNHFVQQCYFSILYIPTT